MSNCYFNQTTGDLKILNSSPGTDYQDLGAAPYKASAQSSWPFDSVRTSIKTATVSISDIVSAAYMFKGCSSLQSASLYGFDTSKITSFQAMFSGCSSIESLNLSSFNTSKVTSMQEMFLDCSNLKYLDISNFDTSNVTSMMFMFGNCTNLKSLDISSFNTSKVSNVVGVFDGCDFDVIDVSSNASKLTAELPKASYYSIVTGSSVSKGSLTAGTYVSLSSYIKSGASIVHVRQGLRNQSKELNNLSSSILNLSTTLEDQTQGLVKYSTNLTRSRLGNGGNGYILPFSKSGQIIMNANEWTIIKVECIVNSSWAFDNPPEQYRTYNILPFVGEVDTGVITTSGQLYVMPFSASFFSVNMLQGNALALSTVDVNTTTSSVGLSFDGLVY